MILNKDEMIKYLNVLYPINMLLNTKRGSNYRCIFHDDLKPSAHLYGNAIYCFTCGRFYYVYNIILKNNLDICKLFNELYEIYNVSSIEELKKLYDSKVVKKEVNESNISVNKAEGIIEYTIKYFKGNKVNIV